MEQGQDTTLDQGALQSNQPETEEVKKARKNVKGGTATCFVIAGLGLLGGLLIVGMQDQLQEIGYDSTVGAIVIVFALGFLALGLWSRKQPYPALLTAMLIYGINAVITFVNFANAGGGVGGFQFVIIGVLLGLLIRGFMGAQKLRKLQRGF